jgi:hypothetical protein
MNTLIKSLVVGALLAVGSAFASPSVDLVVGKSVNVADLRDANLALGAESTSLRVGMGDFRLSINGLDMDQASATVGMKQNLVGFDHVNVSFDRHTVGLGLSRDANIAGALGLTSSLGVVGSDVTSLPSVTASVALSYNVW